MTDSDVPTQTPLSTRPVGLPEVSIAESDISVLTLTNALLRRWRAVLLVPALVASLTLAASLLMEPTYTATTTFVPEPDTRNRLPSGLAGLAGQLGVTLGSEPTQSPRFYAAVLHSRELMEQVLLSRYAPQTNVDSSPTDSVTLLDILRTGGRDRADSIRSGLKALDKLVSVVADPQTNIVRLSVDARYRTLAAAIANRFIRLLNAFNTETRQSRARQRRKFIEGRLIQGEADLRTTEDGLKTFYQGNRSWQQSPQLVFEEGRLKRQVDIRQDVYLTLRREYEAARIEEVNDTPVITVIDPAVPPARKSKPNRLLLTIVAFFIGGAMSLVWTFAAEVMDRKRRLQDPEYREFKDLLAHALHQVGLRSAEQPPGET